MSPIVGGLDGVHFSTGLLVSKVFTISRTQPKMSVPSFGIYVWIQRQGCRGNRRSLRQILELVSMFTNFSILPQPSSEQPPLSPPPLMPEPPKPWFWKIRARAVLSHRLPVMMHRRFPGDSPLASIWDRFLKPSLDVARRTSSSWADSNRPCRCRQLAKPPNVLRRAGIRQLDPTGPWSYSSRSAKSILIVTTGPAQPSPLTPGRYRWRCLSSPCAIPRSPG